MAEENLETQNTGPTEVELEAFELPQTNLNAQEEKNKEAQKLFATLSKKDLTDEELKDATEKIKKDPSLLSREAFVSNIKMPDLTTVYNSGADMNDAVYRSSKSQRDLTALLDNLNKIDLPERGQENAKVQDLKDKSKSHTVKRTAANWFLDNARLENGELVGTQMAKNIHFMGTALKDKENPVYKDPQKNETFNNALKSHMDQSDNFMRNIYRKYGANPQRRNAAGQKVGDVMETALAIRTAKGIGAQRVQTPKVSLQSLQSQPFMQTPVQRQNAPAVKQTTTVEQAPQKRQNTLADAQMAAYQGNATAEQKQLLENEAAKEAEMSNNNDDTNMRPKKEGDDMKFTQKDIVDYMYEDIFLWLLGKGIDFAERAVEYSIAWTFDKLGKGVLNVKKKFKAKNNTKGYAAAQKADLFNKEAYAIADGMYHRTDEKAREYMALSNDLRTIDMANLSPAQEKMLRDKYGDSMVAALKQNPKHAERLTKMSPEQISIRAAISGRIGYMAASITRTEMVDEMMRKDATWRNSKTGEYKLTEELIDGTDGFKERTLKRMENTMNAADTVLADSYSKAQAQYQGQSLAGKKEWINKNIMSSYERLIGDKKVSDLYREQLKKEKEIFKEKMQGGISDEQVYATYASLQVGTYLDRLDQANKKSMTKQATLVEQGKFDAAGKSPDKKDVYKVIEDSDKLTKKVAKEGLGYKELFGKQQKQTAAKNEQRTLEEEALSVQQDDPNIEKQLKEHDRNAAAEIAPRRSRNNERKKRLDETKKKIEEKNNESKPKQPVMNVKKINEGL